MIEFSNPCGDVIGALAEACRLVVNPKKNKQNNHLKNHYADLSSVADAIGPAMTDSGLHLLVIPGSVDQQANNVLIADWRLTHLPSGQHISGSTQVPMSKADPHGFGSSLTYVRRYLKVSIFDLSMSDDDGNRAIKSASDFKKEIMASTTTEELDHNAKTASERFSGDAASLRILRDAYAKRKAELVAKTAKPFNPAAPKNAKKSTAKVIIEPAPTGPEDAPASTPDAGADEPADFSDF